MKNTKLYGVARKNKKEVKRFGKFAIVGLSGLFIDVLLLNILERYFGFSVPLAVAVAFVVAATNNFVWNRLWVYPESRTQPKRKQLPTFLAVNAAGLVINEIIFLLFQASITSLVLLIPISLAVKHHQGIGLNATKAIAALVVMVWNFVVNRMVTFRDVKWQTNTGAPLPPAADDDERIDSAL